MTADLLVPIIFNPSDNPENAYIRILVEGIARDGFAISRLDDLFENAAHFRSIRLVHLNWFENLDESSAKSMWRSFFRKMTALLAIKASGKKLVWTMHNRLSHEKGSGKLSNVLVKLLLKSADAIIIHCEATEEVIHSFLPNFQEKPIFLPHPHFIGEYGRQPQLTQQSQEPLKLLFTGAVKPYKNLELLIRVCREFGEAVQLTIAGKAASEAYATELRSLAMGAESIQLRLGFVENEEMPALIAASDLLVLPYDLRSSLNSGTVILAFSYARTVICPRIGTIDELEKAQSDVFTYSYTTEAEHESELRKAIQRALDLKRSDPAVLLQMGMKMKEHVQVANDPTIAINGLTKLYRELLP